MNQPLVNNPANPIVRSVLTGGIASAVAAGTINMRRVKNEEMEATQAVKETVKRASQGAIATGAAVATASYLSQKGGFFKALTTLSVGMAGIYAIEVLDDKLQEKYTSECCEHTQEVEEDK